MVLDVLHKALLNSYLRKQLSHEVTAVGDDSEVEIKLNRFWFETINHSIGFSCSYAKVSASEIVRSTEVRQVRGLIKEFMATLNCLPPPKFVLRLRRINTFSTSICGSFLAWPSFFFHDPRLFLNCASISPSPTLGRRLIVVVHPERKDPIPNTLMKY